MSNLYSLVEVMNRLTAMQTEVTGYDAAGYWPFSSEVPPYWSNRIVSWTEDTTAIGSGFEVDRYIIGMNLVVGHLTEGYKAEVAQEAYDALPAMADFFAKNRGLTCDAYPDDYVWLMPGPDGGVQITGAPGGNRTVDNSLRIAQVVIELTLSVPLVRRITTL